MNSIFLYLTSFNTYYLVHYSFSFWSSFQLLMSGLGFKHALARDFSGAGSELIFCLKSANSFSL